LNALLGRWPEKMYCFAFSWMASFEKTERMTL
jgi:hypothetical protein